jgi:UDP-N-acetylmuramate dehydrogenase
MDDGVKKLFMILTNDLIEKFGSSISADVKLSNYSWFNLGGNADYFYRAKSIEQLLNFLEHAKKNNLKVTILGAGSNTLFRDKGVRGVVIKLSQDFSYIKKVDKNIIDIGAATLDRKVANYAKENNLSNLEFLSCIPGSIGGAIIMNSGCYGYDISKVLKSVQVVDIKSLSKFEIKKEDIKFSYRGTNLSKNLIIISARFEGVVSNKEDIEKKQLELTKKKKSSQPSQIKTCGSTFKNLSEDKKAWMLIKQAGCENFKEGDAKISEKHCNFFVNNGNAKSSDIENLIKKVKTRVYEKTGIKLELEIKILGE